MSNGGGKFMFVTKGGQTIFCPLWMGYLDWEQREDEPTVTDVPQDAKDLVASMLQVNAEERLDQAEVCKRLNKIVMMHELREAIKKKKQEMQDILNALPPDMQTFAWSLGVSGLKWQKREATEPAKGKELTNSELSAMAKP